MPMLISKEGNDIDLRYFPGPGSGINEVLSLNDMQEGKVLLSNKTRSIDLDVLWDIDFYKHALL